MDNNDNVEKNKMEYKDFYTQKNKKPIYKKTVIYVIVVIVFMALVSLFIYIQKLQGERGSNTQPQNRSLEESQFQNSVSASDTILIHTETNNKFVFIEEASFSKPGFIVVYNDNNGKPGEIIGISGCFNEGNLKGRVYTRLSKDVQLGEVLHVILHEDSKSNPDNTPDFKFSLEDPIIHNEDKSPVGQTIKIAEMTLFDFQKALNNDCFDCAKVE
ncbi:hypothetical protein ACFL25_00650 [Patescibacteria group bacterium]